MCESPSFLACMTNSAQCHSQPATSRVQSGRFWAILTASVNVRLWDSRSFRTVFIHVIRGRPGSLFQSSGGNAVRIFLASILSSNRAMCPNTESFHAWTVAVRSGWPSIHHISALETNWYHLMWVEVLNLEAGYKDPKIQWFIENGEDWKRIIIR